MYTWGYSALDNDYNDPSKGSSCTNCIGQSSRKNGSSRPRGLRSGSSTAISFHDVNGFTKEVMFLLYSLHELIYFLKLPFKSPSLPIPN